MAGVVSADDLHTGRLPTLVSVPGQDARRLEDSFRDALARYHLVADRIGVSAGHLCRTIRAPYGMTPTSFVADLRLRHAEMLLATTSASLTEISYRCGFASPSYFSKSFRSSRGESPRDFRHRAREAVLPRARTDLPDE